MHVSPSLMEQSGEKNKTKKNNPKTHARTHTHIIYKDKANEHCKINANYVPVKHTHTHAQAYTQTLAEL